MIDVYTWTSSFVAPMKHSDLHGCNTAVASDVQLPAASLPKELAAGWLVVSCSLFCGILDDAEPSSRVLWPV